MLRRSCTHYKTLDLSLFRLLGEQADDNREHYAEEEHPNAEGIYVHLVEQIAEQIVALRIENHHYQTGESEHETYYQSPHAGLRSGLLPGNAQQEDGRDGRGQQTLDALYIIVQALAHSLDDKNPKHTQNHHYDCGYPSYAHEFLLAHVRMPALVDVYGIEHCG